MVTGRLVNTMCSLLVAECSHRPLRCAEGQQQEPAAADSSRQEHSSAGRGVPEGLLLLLLLLHARPTDDGAHVHAAAIAG